MSSIPVILVMGRTGSGKSQFINTAVEQPATEVGHDLDSKTVNPQLVLCECDAGSVYLLDTPGFDNTDKKNDVAILKRIVDWLKESEETSPEIMGSNFCGILYLIEATQHRFPMFQHLKSANPCFIVLATKGREKRRDVAVDCVFESGSQVSAWNAIRAVLKKEQEEENSVRLFVEKLNELLAEKPSTSKPKSRKCVGKWRKFLGLQS